jgi:hypothetical protein
VVRTVFRALPSGVELQLLDLGTGAGSNIRYLAERLPGPQRWLAVDGSADLLAELRRRMAEWAVKRDYESRADGDSVVVRGPGIACRIETRQMDLGHFDDPGIFEGRHLVTASALLDLVSSAWLRSLAAHCARVRAAALFAITYDGRTTSLPPEPEDDEVLTLFNRHQLTDKGLGGAASGPGAAAAAAQAFADAGYTVMRERSDWNIDPSACEFQQMLVDGWARAASEIAPDRAGAIAGWRKRRMAHIAAGTSRIVVGHEDLAATAPGGHLMC